MTIIEAIERSLPTPTRREHLGIRRLCWMHGRRIQWDAKSTRWKFGNEFVPNLLSLERDPGVRELDAMQSQGCLTPESLTAIDWEIVL